MTAAVGAARGAGAGGAWLLALPVAAFIVVFLAWPVATVLYTAFADGQGGFTTGHIGAFLSISLMREAFVNSLVVALGSVAFATLIAVPLAYLTVRFEFRGAALVQTLGVLPLVMPPFVGAVAMQLLFGRNGSVNLLLNDAFGIRIPFMDGLNGVIFVEGAALLSLHPAQSRRPRSATSTARWRKRRRTSAATASGCSAASCSRSPRRASSRAPRWCSSRCSTISARRSC